MTTPKGVIYISPYCFGIEHIGNKIKCPERK
jgi:hypothetical protein